MATDQVAKRLANQYAILRTLHFEGPLQRSLLSERLGIRKSSVTNIVSDLLEAGLIREETPGRIRSAVGLDVEQVHALCASVGPHGVRFGRVHLDGRVEDAGFKPCELSAPDVVVDVLTHEFSARQKRMGGRTLSLGVALPGVVDSVRGVCVQAVNLHGWRDVPLATILSERLGVAVSVDNDVRCQLWACTWFGRLARDAENVIYLLVHEGVACAIMTHGRLIVGERFSAGEIGHVRVGDEGRLCSCGRTDCLESYCSVPAVLGELAMIRPDLTLAGTGDIAKAAGDVPAIGNVLDRLASRLARALAGLVAAVDPSVLVLGTSDRSFSELLKPLLQRHLYNELIGLQASSADILMVDDVEMATLRGIAGLGINQAFAHGALPGSSSKSSEERHATQL